MPKDVVARAREILEAKQLCSGPRDEWRTMIFVALRTGLRRGELLGLRWSDVDLAAGRLMVRQAYVHGEFVVPKSGRPREVPLGDDVIEELRVHRHERGPLVFCDHAGKPLSSGSLMWPLARALKHAGLRSIGWHMLRHTFASHLAMRGVALKVIQELLGHSSIETTMIYAHLMPEVARDAVRTLDLPRSPAGPPSEGPVSAAAPRKSVAKARKSSPAPAIPVAVAKDWRNSPDTPVTN